MKVREVAHKATIETLINTTAIALTSTGTIWVLNDLSHKGMGLVLILFGIGLEFGKYWGRRKELW